MRLHLLLNPGAGSAAAADVLRASVATSDALSLTECDGAGGLRAAAAEAARAGVDVVVAVGGDGTVHEVANGLMDVGASADERPALGVIPLGTGNDLARTLALPLGDPDAALALLTTGERRPLDLIRAASGGRVRWAANVCAGGFSGQVDEVLEDQDLKARWGPMGYLVAAAKVLPGMTPYAARLTWDDAEDERLDVLNVVVANGRTAAGGRPAAPKANPEDGLLEVVVVLASSGVELAKLAAQALAADYLQSDRVVHRRARRLYVEAEPGMPFNVDGEMFTDGPITFEAVPGALRVVVGPDYQPDVEAAAPDATP